MEVEISIFSELERDIIVERVKAGMCKAREQDKQIGRPKAVFAKIISFQKVVIMKRRDLK